MQDAPLEPYDLAEPDVDLAAEPDRLDTTFSAHADSVRLWWHGTPVGRIHPVAGAERLSASQFRHVVIQSFGVILFKRLSEAGLLNQWPLAAAPEPNPAGISAASERRFGRTQVAEFDLCRPTHVWNLERCDNVQLLVRNQGRPVANIRLPLHPGTAVLKDNELLTELTVRGVRPECDAGPHESTFQPPVSVIVCTRDRPYALRRCLAALKSLDYSNYEVTVVDNASAGTETAELVSESGFHYIREERPGLNWARNRGIAESRHDIIAYVDDDAVVDRGWLRAITAALDESDAVTGLVLAAELIFPAQHLFEQYGGMGKGMGRQILNGSRMSDVEKVAAHAAGVGANMAFGRRTFERVGVFDTALDVGTPSSGGGDLDMFHRILASGLTIRYEPEAIIWHYHRRDPGQLRKQLYNNGRAFGVYLLKILRSRSVPRRSALQYAVLNWLGGWLVVRLWRVLTRRERFPVSLVLAEMWGATHALWAYRTTYKLDRRRRSSEPAKDQCSTC
jgi:glycosyltransferase involved in cell wall biosynthesis